MNFSLKLFLLATITIGKLNSQNFVVSQLQMPKCYGACDGKITFTTGAVTGPFTAVLTNTGSCPNSTIQNTTFNSITIDSICGCSSAYTVAIYNPSMMLVGTMIQNIINYATGPLAFGVSSIVPATCSNCCDGSFNFTVSGGNQMSPPTYSVDGTFTNNVNPLYYLCVGSHTVCIMDASGCTKCIPVTMPYQGGFTSVGEFENRLTVSIYPNPADNYLHISPLDLPMVSFEIMDLSGRRVTSENFPAGVKDLIISTSELHPGIFTLTLRGENGEQFHCKFVKSDY